MSAPAPARKRGRSPGTPHHPNSRKPRSKLPQDVLARIGPPPPPTDPLARAQWASTVIGELIWLQANGLLDSELGKNLRAACSALSRATPLDVLAEIDRRMKASDDELKLDAAGPEPEKQHDEQPRGALRRQPR